MKTQIEGIKIRKWCEYFEEVSCNEISQKIDPKPLHKFAVGAVILNPYAGTFSENLQLLTDPSKELGEAFGERLIRAANGNEIISYGKSCVIGVNGEYEHGNACLTADFANPLRESIGGGIAWIPSTGKIGGPGTEIDIPLAHKNALYVRSYYDTLTLSINDSPKPNEILVLFAGASRGRINARLGGLDEKDVSGVDGLK